MIFIDCVPDEWPKRIELAVTAYGKGGQDEFGAEDAHGGMAGHRPAGGCGGAGAERPGRGSDCSARAEAGGGARGREHQRGNHGTESRSEENTSELQPPMYTVCR